MTHPTEHPILIRTFTAGAAVTAHRFFQADGTPAGAGEDAVGVSRTDAADTHTVAVTMVGTALVEAGAAVLVGAQVAADAAGKAVTAVATNRVLGVALTAAGADEEIIEVALIGHPIVPA